MKSKKGHSVGLFEVDDNGYARLWLIGIGNYFYRKPPNNPRVIHYDETRAVIKIIGENTFNTIKEKGLLAETLFPYDKNFEDLEVFEP